MMSLELHDPDASAESAQDRAPSNDRHAATGFFEPRIIDDDPVMLAHSYRLRYQVYCLERQFLPAADYPDQLERDDYDHHSIHLGAIDSHGLLAATARLVRPGRSGLPLFRHCTLFPDQQAMLEAPTASVVEVSRVSISRHYARRRLDPPLDNTPRADPESADPEPAAAAQSARERRQRRAEPFLSLLKAIIYAAKLVGATHLIGATDAALHRWLVHYGFPYRIAGPEADYYGTVAPNVMSLTELDQVILSRRFAVLDGFPVALGPAPWPRMSPPGGTVA